MIFLGVFALTVCGFISSVDGRTGWCYHDASCNDTKWPTLFPQYCNGSRQSPINIDTKAAKGDDSLTTFTFTNFTSNTTMKTIENTGKTLKVRLNSGVQISGGGFTNTYDTLQFHLHWGNGSAVPGSEHTVDGVRHPMEIHFVNVKASYNGNTTQAVGDSTGLAALGFFIDVMSDNDTGKPEAWKKLTGYLTSLATSGTKVNISDGFSLDDLLNGVNRTNYYRYLGSLTTPDCNEAVVWTVFKEPIKVSKDLIDLFSTSLHVENASSPIMVNTYRSIQPNQPVTTQSSASTASYSLGLILLSLALWKN